MGQIKIEVAGSFRERDLRIFSAIHGGHADAVAEAIEYLVAVQLPAAIRLDHELAKNGDAPRLGFGNRPKKMSEHLDAAKETLKAPLDQ